MGLNAWPSRWLTAMKGLLSALAKAFPKLNPTDKQTINPGPAVGATASIS